MIRFNERYPEASGIIGEFLSLDDPRPAREQINEAYAHGGGWRPFEGFKPLIDFDDPRNCELYYPEDPEIRAKAFAYFRDELIVIFEHDWCLITPRAGNCSEFTIARLD